MFETGGWLGFYIPTRKLKLIQALSIENKYLMIAYHKNTPQIKSKVRYRQHKNNRQYFPLANDITNNQV